MGEEKPEEEPCKQTFQAVLYSLVPVPIHEIF